MPIILFATGVFAETKNQNIEKENLLSANQGKLKWVDAKAKCEKSGMRLPTRAEIKKAFDSGETKSWPKDWEYELAWYWTSEEDSKGGTYGFFMPDGNFSSNLSKQNENYIRCIKK